MSRNIRAFLDTNTLIGGLSTDILLSCAEMPDAAYKPLWNSHVVDELREHLPERILAHGRNGDTADATEAAESRIRAMLEFFPESMVEGWSRAMPEAIRCVRDAEDAQILAGGIVGGADVVVTQNVGDFRRDAIRTKYGIRVLRESEFLSGLLAREPAGIRRSLVRMVSSHRHPPRNLRELCERMADIPELSGFGENLAETIRRTYQTRHDAIFHIRQPGRQGRNGLGQYTRAYGGYDSDIANPEGFDQWWGPDGNGPEL